MLCAEVFLTSLPLPVRADDFARGFTTKTVTVAATT